MGVPFEQLNEAQKRAVKIIGNRILILAGPGTGKTEVLSHRIRFLIKHKGTDPSQILAVTFTIKAAREMMKRLMEFPDFNPTGVRILTIHGEVWKILCQNLSNEISIANDDEATMILKDTLEDLGLRKSGRELNRIKRDIELKKAENKLPEDLNILKEEFLTIFRKYEDLMKFNKAIDFGGILTNINRLLKDRHILRDIQSKTKYLLVDEYQDINQAQFEFIQSLCHTDSEFFCVGDDDQSIYGWRGAKPDFILNFEKDFEGSQALSLEETRRCPENILKAVINLISRIPKDRRKSKIIYAYYKNTEPIYILKSSSEVQEALWIAGWVTEEIFKQRFKPKEIAIICRDIELAKYVVRKLQAQNVPVVYWKESALFKDPVVKDIIAHLRVIIKTQNNLALRRCLLSGTIKDIGEKRVMDLRKKSQEVNKPIWEILPTFYEQPHPKKWQINLSKFVEWMRELIRIAEDNPVSVLIDKIIEKINFREENKYVQKLKNLAQLSKLPARKFIDEIIIKKKLDLTEGGPEPEDTEEAVAVMSMHSSKGLTYKVVFILGMEEKIFPRDNSNVDDEERRLCYVAMTRAKEKLFLCAAKRRKGRPAQGLTFYDRPSQFLNDIHPCRVQVIDNYSDKKK